jgi:broad specificity phosphatase PhoE
MTTRLLLVAAASTAATRRAAFAADDEPLEESGRQAARALWDASPPRRVTRYLVAPERRAAETAATLDPARCTVDPHLRDLDAGRWTGRDFDDLLREEPEALSTWRADPAAASPGGESLVDLLTRAEAFLDRCREPGEQLVAVTHPAVIRAVMVTALAATTETWWRLDIGPLAQVALVGNANRWTLRSVIP